MGLLSREIVRRVAPLVVAGAAGAAGAVMAQRRLAEQRRLRLTPGPPPSVPPVPVPPPRPVATATGPTPPAPEPTPPAPEPTPPVPQPGIAIASDASQGPEAATDVVVGPEAGDADLEQRVRSALTGAALEGAGAVDVEVVGAMVVLRGRVDSPEAIRELERTAAGVRGVEGVRVLLHLPGRARRRP